MCSQIKAATFFLFLLLGAQERDCSFFEDCCCLPPLHSCTTGARMQANKMIACHCLNYLFVLRSSSPGELGSAILLVTMLLLIRKKKSWTFIAFYYLTQSIENGAWSFNSSNGGRAAAHRWTNICLDKTKNENSLPPHHHPASTSAGSRAAGRDDSLLPGRKPPTATSVFCYPPTPRLVASSNSL